MTNAWVGVVQADNGGGAGTELWTYDPSTSTSTLVDINGGAGSSTPTGFVGVGDLVFFAADDGASGVELWQYSPLSQAANINTGGSSNPQSLTSFEGSL